VQKVNSLFIGNKITLLDSVDSTNAYVKSNCDRLIDGEVVVSKIQTEGRGRFKRKWISDTEGNLYASFIIKDSSWLEMPTHLPIFVAVVLRRAVLDSLSTNSDQRLGFKWPNDIVVDAGKLSGILIEASDNGYIVGVGLNVLSAPLIPNVKTTCLANIYGGDEVKNPNELINFFVEAYNMGVKQYLNIGFGTFKSEWERFCAHLNKKVALREGIDDNTQQTEAMFKGLDTSGGARVLFEGDRKEKTVYYGELDV